MYDIALSAYRVVLGLLFASHGASTLLGVTGGYLGKGDSFDHKAAVGFIQIWGLPTRVQARNQLLKQPEGPLGIGEPERRE